MRGSITTDETDEIDTLNINTTDHDDTPKDQWALHKQQTVIMNAVDDEIINWYRLPLSDAIT